MTRRLCRELEGLGAATFAAVGGRASCGWPDRYLAHPLWCGWVEFKRRGARPTKAQELRIQALTTAGAAACWVEHGDDAAAAAGTIWLGAEPTAWWTGAGGLLVALRDVVPAGTIDRAVLEDVAERLLRRPGVQWGRFLAAKRDRGPT